MDKKTVQYRRGFGFDFDTKLIDDSPVVEELFNSVMKGFNEIKNRKLSDSIPVLRGINANYP
nr:MAG TPA: transcriptional enhancer factor [Bacteriophage sp.]